MSLVHGDPLQLLSTLNAATTKREYSQNNSRFYAYNLGINVIYACLLIPNK